MAEVFELSEEALLNSGFNSESRAAIWRKLLTYYWDEKNDAGIKSDRFVLAGLELGDYSQLCAMRLSALDIAVIKEIESEAHTAKSIYDAPGLLTSVLEAYAVRNSNIAYSPGMNQLVALLLMGLEGNEESSFCGMILILEEVLVKHYSKGLSGKEVDSLVLEKILLQYRNKLATHLKKISIHSLIEPTSWLTSMFISMTSLECNLRIWDILLSFVASKSVSEGVKWLFSVQVALLDIMEQELLLVESESDLLETFSEFSITAKNISPEKLIEAAKNILVEFDDINVSEMRKYTEKELKIKTEFFVPKTNGNSQRIHSVNGDVLEMKEGATCEEAMNGQASKTLGDIMFEVNEEKCMVFRDAILRKPIPSCLATGETSHDLFVDVKGELTLTNFRFIFSSAVCFCFKDVDEAKQIHDIGCPVSGRGMANGSHFYPWPDIQCGSVSSENGRTVSPRVVINLYSIKRLENVGSNEMVILCKDMRKLRFQFPSKDHRKGCMDVCKPMCFASVKNNFSFLSRTTDYGWDIYDAKRDYARLGMTNCERLRLLEQSESYNICSTYPRSFVVASAISDADIARSCSFRSRSRIPAAVWMHPKNGAILARCAQPLVGLRNMRCREDEKLVSALMLQKKGNANGISSNSSSSDDNSDKEDACGNKTEAQNDAFSTASSNPENEADGVTQFVSDVWTTLNSWNNGSSASTAEGGDSRAETVVVESGMGRSKSSPQMSENTEIDGTNVQQKKNNKEYFYIVDARSQMATMGNRAMGKGTENAANYTGARLIFMNVENIHAVRNSFERLTELVQPTFVGDSFERALADTGWLQQVKNILTASVEIVKHIDQHGRSVLTHCSDGWDRTAQMVAMAELLLDPWYRTCVGFAELVEKEWCSFGHKFRDRYGHGRNTLTDHEVSPCFTLWIDCVWQVIRQFPTAFEFNVHFLTTLIDNTYSGRYDPTMS